MQILTQTLTYVSQGIKKIPGICGGDACVGDARIPIRSLVNNRHLGMSDAKFIMNSRKANQGESKNFL